MIGHAGIRTGDGIDRPHLCVQNGFAPAAVEGSYWHMLLHNRCLGCWARLRSV